MIKKFITKMRDPKERKFFYTLFGGKLMGAGLCLLLMWAAFAYFEGSTTKAHADDTAIKTEASPADGPLSNRQGTSAVTATPSPAPAEPPAYVNPINTAWVLLGGFLVFGMQAGFTMLEAGFCRERETVNVLVECMFDTCVCGILHWAFGFAIMFGGGNALFGWHLPGDPTKNLIFMKDVSLLATYGSTGIPILAHFLFQFAFADCASTICSGAMVGRTRFWGDILYSIGVSGIIYPVFGHWCWGPNTG